MILFFDWLIEKKWNLIYCFETLLNSIFLKSIDKAFIIFKENLPSLAEAFTH